DCYIKGGRRTIVVTDRLSAFDVVLGTIPFKGQVLNQMAAYWFQATADLVPNHVLSVPDPQVMVGQECQLLPVEFVMRSFMTGVTSTSIWSHYQRGLRQFCGHDLPDGMRKNQRLPRALLTPSTKAEKGGHDESVSRAQILEMGILDGAAFDEAAEMCDRLFAFGQQEALKRGLILVDTKYEVGRRPDGKLCFIDEIHTPDSSRYWYADDYQSRFDKNEEPRGLDKEYVRRTLAEQGYKGDGPPPALTDEVRVEAARRYIQVCELVTGRPFVPDTAEPIARIRKNLGL
ncbi:MAG: phosphoribosylaminoimidazolesuccinocarboxamide synthase, partial [Pseudomonadota bacterium]